MFIRKTAGFQIAEYIAGRAIAQLSREDYRVLMAPEAGLPDRFKEASKSHPPALAVYRKEDEIPLWILEVDPQACGPQKDFANRIRLYEEAGVMELWIFYPKDQILVVRKLKEGGNYTKPAIYSAGDSVPVGLLPVEPFSMDSLLEIW